ncbi:1-phosphofructokinase family hexose kinase [Roseomonas elaeocarpi]|uniref:Phosphofructokinase n=1 Tax=Roseomonas elaeocarpi TaxID=907779 RepID=A0ABV6JRX4_9PROT
MAPRIVTLTLNPAVDLACEAEVIRPTHKIRTTGERHDPGGGGINVSRVVAGFGGETEAIVLAGGPTGQLLEALLDEGGIPRTSIPIAGMTRISQTVLERSTGREYRFVPEGPGLAEAEWRQVLARLETVEGDWIVASGSLPSGVPQDFYAQTARIARRRGQRFALDTSGAALKAALDGDVTLIKPSLSELQSLVGRELPDPADQDRALLQLVRDGAAEIIALTLGADGAVLATNSGVLRLPALKVEVRGAVGAGDSFLAAMVLALANGRSVEDAFAWGIAAGAAAVSRSGTAHPERADVEVLRRQIGTPLE